MELGSYEILGELACGGMAVVYVGRLAGPDGTPRDVAIKELYPQYARDPEFRSRFLDEAQLVQRIRHPNVAATFGIATKGADIHILMELVDGEPVSTLMRRSPRPVPPSIAAAIARDALLGLHAAHELVGADGRTLDVVHRDVSPGNILVGRDGIARIIDFGVATAVGRSMATRDGSIRGKLSYMPPEQLWGGVVDRTADVYGLAVVLWELLAGRRLHAGKTEGETVHSVIYGTVPPPSEGQRRAHPLDDVVLRGLSRDPSKRFATALEMVQAIDAAIGPASRLEVSRWMSAQALPSTRSEYRALSALPRPARPVESAGAAGESSSARAPRTWPPSPRRCRDEPTPLECTGVRMRRSRACAPRGTADERSRRPP
jgi:serine/threonine-protein kinase